MIPILSDILSESVKEKVTRIVLATFRVRILIYIISNVLQNKVKFCFKTVLQF